MPRAAYMSRAQAIPVLKSVTPEDLMVELLHRGVRSFPPESLLIGTSTCPHCNRSGEVAAMFGVRVVGGKFRSQSWCRDCRKDPSWVKAKHTPQTSTQTVELLRQTLEQAGLTPDDLKEIAIKLKGEP